MRCSPAFGGDQREGEPGAHHRDVGTLFEQERDRADVILVGVRQDKSLDVLETVLDMTQVRQDQVHSGFVVAGKQHAAVNDEQPAQMLENRHVRPISPIPPSAVTRSAPGASGPGGRRSAFVNPEPFSAALISAGAPSTQDGRRAHIGGEVVELAAVAGICGSRGSPASKPCSRRPLWPS